MANQTIDELASQALNSPTSTPLASPNANPSPPVPLEVLDAAKKQREEGRSFIDYAAATVRQDSPIPGLISSVHGWQMQPVPGYSSYADPEQFKKLTEGIAPEYHNEFLGASSPEQAAYIRERLLQKQSDMQTLGDMGTVGTVGRLAYGLTEPTALIAGMASGGTGFIAKAGTMAKTAAGIASGAATMAGVEKLRQSVNFENNNAQVLEAALIAGVFTAPFAAAGARQSSRAGTAALREREALELLRKQHEGTPLTPEEHATLAQVQKDAEVAAGVENGTLPHDAMDAVWHKYETKKQPAEMSADAGTTAEKRVFWNSDEGSGIDHGTVVGEAGNGKLIVEHEDTGERLTVDRADLHPESPEHLFESPKEAPLGEAGFHPVEAANEPSKGFLGNSVGSAQVDHIGAPETVMNRNIPMLDKLGIKIPMRFDLYAQLNRSPNPVIQKWAQRLIKDPIGSKDGFSQARTATEEKKLMQRKVEGQTMLVAQEAFNKVREIRKLGPIEAHKAHRSFFEDVTAVVSGDKDVLKMNSDIAPELEKAAGAYREMYRQLAEEARATGVKGAEHLTPDDFYVNRSWQLDKIKQAMKAHGEDNVASLLAHSFKDSSIYGNIAKAKAFLRVILKTEFSHHLQDIHLASRDMNTLRTELSAIDPKTGQPFLSDHDIDALVDVLFSKKASAGGDAGTATNLKFRMDLDEGFSQKMANGETLKVSDLMERDARILASKYVNSMSGHIAMAKRGIHSRAEFEAAVVKAALDHHAENGMLTPDGGQFNKDLQWMRDIYDNITGRPMSTQVFNNMSRMSSAIRALSRSTYLGELGLTAAGEVKQTLALTSMRAFYLQSPAFADFLRSLRSGRIANSELAREIEQLWGFGLEHNAAHARQHEFTEFTYDRGLSKLENITNQASHAIDSMSGNSSVTSGTRQFSAMAFIQHHFDLATGKAELTPSKIKRLAHQGIEADEIHDVMEDLKRYTTYDATNGRVESVDWERWQQEHPDRYEQYHLAIERETRDAIQDHDLGETIPWGHTQMGKIFLELRTFTAVAHAKNFLKNMSYADRTSFNVWTYNMMGEALMYAMQTSINFAHNKDELDKRLTLPKIAAAAVQRAGMLGMMPSVLSTGYWMGSGGHDLFGGVGTANTDNRNLIKTPSMMLLEKGYNTTKTLGGALNPFSNTVTTNKEFKDAFSMLPGSNLYGLRNLNDYLSSTFPKHELRQVAP